jgi:hypothetical protein
MRKFKLKYILVFLFTLIVSTAISDVIRISEYEVIPSKPDKKIDCKQDQVQYDLAKGKIDINWNDLDGTLEFIRNEYDCSDFRLVNLIRILYEAGDKIPADYKAKIEKVLFNFRYWWDEPGENSMCYWSENHQILFISAEYLVGQLYPDSIFPSSGLTGRQHMEKSRQRAMDWFEMRWNYGFIEFNSEVYYKEDVGALINLIDFAKDDEMVKKSQIMMDLLFYDVAVQNSKTMFISATGRAYTRGRQGGPDANLGGITRYYWGDGKEIKPSIINGMITTKKYQLPPVLAEIAKDSATVIIKQSNGLNLSELKTEGYYGTNNRSMMMQWGMEAFTNPMIVRNSLSHIRKHISFSNESVAPFKTLDFFLLRWLHLEPLIMRIINPQTNGIAIQKGNTYTYKTKGYSMYTAQSYHPGTYGDQQHVFGLNISNHFSIFHTHPALKKSRKNQSPNYNVGYGHIPHVAQDKNVSLAIYNIPKRKGIMEMDLLDFTRAYFPSEKFDTAFIDGNYIFGKKDETYCAFIGYNTFHFADTSTDNIIQPGKKVFWITEAGSQSTEGSFDAFTQRIKNNKLHFNAKKLELSYQSKEKQYDLKFGADFSVDGKPIDTHYMRYDSPYVKAKVKTKTLTYQFNGKTLHLDFENLKREFN